MNTLQKINSFYQSFAGEKFSIGTSVLGQPIPCMQLGEGRPVVIVQYAIHAREWITSLLALEQIRNFFARGTFYFLPVTNPDGVALATNDFSFFTDNVAIATKLEALRRLNGNRTDFSLWKANARGVDLNVNFDADWGTGAQNVNVPAGENYVGEFPVSEPETRALVAFTKRVRPDATLSYHAKGEEIYWYFNQTESDCERDFSIARSLAACTGYAARYTPGSVGGYKDWCISAFKIPAFTIEVGSDSLKHPVSEAHLRQIAEQNRYLLHTLAEELLWRIN